MIPYMIKAVILALLWAFSNGADNANSIAPDRATQPPPQCSPCPWGR